MSRKIPDILTLEEQQLLLDQFNLRYITPHRNKTIIKFLLATGLRLSEMTNLKWSNVNLMSGQIKVVEGKGMKDRIIYIDDEMIEDLQEWKERMFEAWGPSEYVFTTRSLKLLDGSSVRKMIRIYIDKANINKDITTHSLRHTFASDLLRECKNIRIVQKALGHSDISSTQIYTHIVDEELEDAMKRLRRKRKSL